MPADDSPQRIAKVMARLGICSRRQAERLIMEGKVSVNGHLILSPAFNISSQDRLTVEGKNYAIAQQEKTRLWRYYKTPGLICSHKDAQGRPTVFQEIQTLFPKLPYLVSVGRLDFNSEGLLLLTNDGELARNLELPSQKIPRVYRVRVRGTPHPKELEKLNQGITVKGIRYGPIQGEIDRVQNTNTWLILKLAEGKNREIRKVMEHLGYPVSRLIRISFGPFQLAPLKPKEINEVPTKDIQNLQHSLG